MKAFDVAKVSKMDPDDYILYQISKSKKYDMEILEEEAEKRGMERGLEKGFAKGLEKAEVEHVLMIHSKGYSANQISDLFNIPLDKVITIVSKHSADTPH